MRVRIALAAGTLAAAALFAVAGAGTVVAAAAPAGHVAVQPDGNNWESTPMHPDGNNWE